MIIRHCETACQSDVEAISEFLDCFGIALDRCLAMMRLPLVVG